MSAPSQQTGIAGTTGQNQPPQQSTVTPDTYMFLPLKAFVIGTLLYCIFRIMSSPESESIISFIYILLTVITQLMINGIIAKSKNCKAGQIKILLSTFITWFIIFIMLAFLLKMLPSWKRPFANTFGYLAILGLNIRKILVGSGDIPGLLKSQSNPIDCGKGIDKASCIGLSDAIKNIYSDPTLIVNEFSPDNFDNTMARMQHLFTNPPNMILLNKFKKFVNIRYIISETIWYLLGGMVAISTSQTVLSNICKGD